MSILKPSRISPPAGLLMLLRAALLPSALTLLAGSAVAEPEPSEIQHQSGLSAAHQLQAIEMEIAQQQLLQPLTDRVTFHQQNEPDPLFEIQQGGIAMPADCSHSPCLAEDRP
ncbi:hypothetical protein [Oceanobacter mangrovi]|uniref:hypothetical protein n=1 Tax=Oceanobacter mangrovi TaxID=2862510 RepID=UPI001C8DBA33|nr:hypothetical protein [Oceanobacter mangrovi]